MARNAATTARMQWATGQLRSLPLAARHVSFDTTIRAHQNLQENPPTRDKPRSAGEYYADNILRIYVQTRDTTVYPQIKTFPGY
jgi:hypothetical protein